MNIVKLIEWDGIKYIYEENDNTTTLTDYEDYKNGLEVQLIFPNNNPNNIINDIKDYVDTLIDGIIIKYLEEQD